MRKIGGYILASYGPTMMTSEDHERVKAPRAQWKSTFGAADTAEVLRPFGQNDRDEYGAALRSIKPASGTPIVNDRGCLPSTMPVCTQIARKGTRRLDYVLTRRVPAWTRVQDNRSAASLREDPATNPLRVTR